MSITVQELDTWIKSNWTKKFDKKTGIGSPADLGITGSGIFDIFLDIKDNQFFVWGPTLSDYESDADFIGFVKTEAEISALLPITAGKFIVAYESFTYAGRPIAAGKSITYLINQTVLASTDSDILIEDVLLEWNLTGGGGGDASGITYTNLSPVVSALGGISPGDTFDAVPVSEMFTRLLYPYQVPAFTGFSISGLADAEVGDSFPGTLRTATWSTTNQANIQANTISITDVTNGNTSLLSGSTNDGSQSITVPTLTKTSASSHTFRIEAVNTKSNSLTRNFTINWRWAMYYGESALSTVDGLDVNMLRVKELSTNSSKTYSFLPGEYKYICYPTVFGLKTTFKDTATNLDVAMLAPYTITVTNTNGITTDFYIHRTLNKLGGSINIQVSN